jgi:DNA-binding NarL/FixJ family response regulator
MVSGLLPRMTQPVLRVLLMMIDTRNAESSLTSRECEVLALLAEGMTRPQIARDLYISLNTVDRHVLHIFRKLNAHTAIQAINNARRQGVLAAH